MYTKSQPDIKFIEFIQLVAPVASFKSIENKEYVVKSIVGTNMNIIRKSTVKIWAMDLRIVHQAYLELKDVKAENLKAYVPLTHSPALGLWLHVGLLKN